MDVVKLEQILNDVKNGKLDINDALKVLKNLPFEDMGFAKLDSHRSLRTGYPEVIYCKGKTVEQIVKIVEKQSVHNSIIIATKADNNVSAAMQKIREDVYYNEIAQILVIGARPEKTNNKIILIVSAGTSDIPVAEEAAVTAEALGNTIERLYDVGVAGIHRLLGNMEIINRADVLIVIAGMDGVLPSIVGGLVDKPVIAVPTSVGYGASFQGLAALLTMLNSCSPGVVVVNIDNGFGAGFFASMLINQSTKAN